MPKTFSQKNIFKNILTAIFTIFIFFLSAEIMLRLISIRYKVSPGPSSSYMLQTSEFKTIVRTNRLNLRDYEVSPKRDNEYRILCLGDSFTFGVGVNLKNTYVKVLERLLNKESQRYTVINGGGHPFLTSQYNFLISKRLILKPDLIICQIYIGNDFYDQMGKQINIVGEKIQSLPNKKVSIRDTLKKKLFAKFYLECTYKHQWG